MKQYFEKIPRMTFRAGFSATLTAMIAMLPLTSDGSELERLRALVAEQERQIRLLEEQNARLRNEEPAPRTASRPAASTGSAMVSSGGPASRAPEVSPASGASGEYTVAAGDSLERIGRRFGVSVAALERANELRSGAIIHPGQKLRIPGTSPAAAAVAANPAAPANKTPSASTSTATHRVRAGDTFYSIARQYGVSVNRLIAANPDVSPTSMRVGQTIRLVEARTASAAPAATTNATPATPAEPAGRVQAAAAPPRPEIPSGVNASAANPPQRQSIRTIMIEREMSFRDIAEKYGTTPERINELSGLDIDSRTILAKGSELYVPAQP